MKIAIDEEAPASGAVYGAARFSADGITFVAVIARHGNSCTTCQVYRPARSRIQAAWRFAV